MTNNSLPNVPYMAIAAPTESLLTPQVRFAYRSFGKEEAVPLVLLMRAGGTMDDWDPAFIEMLAQHRKVYLFDSAGVGRSTGSAPHTMEGMGFAAAGFMESMGLRCVDVLGHGLGGMVAQQLGLDRPDLVRRLVLAGSSAGYLAGAPTPTIKTPQATSRETMSDEALISLMFPETTSGRIEGFAHLERLRLRRDLISVGTSSQAIIAQQAALTGLASYHGSLHRRLPDLTKPVLVAHGAADIMLHPYHSYAMALALPDARLTLYPKAGHGFLFHRANQFGRDVLAFLA